MAEEQTLSSQYLYEGRAVKLRIDKVQTESGRETTREIIEHADCVAVVAVDADDKVLLVRQFRKPVEKVLLEIAAGGIDPGEDPEDAVRREMQEETGYFPQKLESLGGFYATPGYGTEYLYLYIASELTPSRLIAEDTEGIEVVRLPLNQAMKLIATGEICDAKSIAGLFKYREYRKTNQKKG